MIEVSQPIWNKSTPITQQKSNLDKQTQRTSHIILTIVCCLLIAFSLSSGITIYLIIQQFHTISGLNGVSLYMLIVGIIISVLAILAILFSWKRITWYLHLYQFVCLVMLASFILVLIGVIMMDLNKLEANPNTSSSNNLANTCYSPKNYFQLKMLEISNQAANLLCSSTCPCPKYSQVTQCPTWVATPYDIIIRQMQQQFSCSGWCAINKATPFMFNGPNDKQISGTCHDQWLSWIGSKYRAVLGCVITMMFILFTNIVITNWRILQIWDKQEQ